MSVKLISYTQSQDNNIQSITDFIAYIDRSSNPVGQQTVKNNETLICYLMKNNHWSPFEMVNICLEIETTRDIAREILIHRCFSFKEFSRNCMKPALEFNTRDARMQDTQNSQNSLKIDDDFLEEEWEQKQMEVINKATETYNWAITKGIAKEEAIVILPECNAKVGFYANGTLRSWIRFVELQGDNEGRPEYQNIVKLCINEISTIFPQIMNCVNY